MFSRLLAFLHFQDTAPLSLDGSLHQLSLGQTAEVIELIGEGEVLGRLQALGLCRGRVLRLLQKGDPMIVEVLGTRLGLSARLGQHIRIKVL